MYTVQYVLCIYPRCAFVAPYRNYLLLLLLLLTYLIIYVTKHKFLRHMETSLSLKRRKMVTFCGRSLWHILAVVSSFFSKHPSYSINNDARWQFHLKPISVEGFRRFASPQINTWTTKTLSLHSVGEYPMSLQRWVKIPIYRPNKGTWPVYNLGLAIRILGHIHTLIIIMLTVSWRNRIGLGKD